MKRPNWEEPYASASYPSFQPSRIVQGSLKELQPGQIGRGFIGDVTLYLKIQKNQGNKLFEAVVTGFNPPTAKIPDLKIDDEVEIDILHFLPGQGN